MSDPLTTIREALEELNGVGEIVEPALAALAVLDAAVILTQEEAETVRRALETLVVPDGRPRLRQRKALTLLRSRLKP